MYKSPSEAKAFVRELEKSLPKKTNAEVVIFPSALSCQSVAESLQNISVSWGGQNSYFESKGAFTGENSAEVLKEMGAKYVLVGHSERRKFFGETDALLAKKVSFIQKLGLIPMLCVGEDLSQRESGQTDHVILNQLREGLKGSNLNADVVIAYEPVWAIGTGKVATPQQAEEAHKVLRAELKNLGNADISVLYGGSVKPDNAGDLIKQENIDGFLIGGASLEVKSFIDILVKIF